MEEVTQEVIDANRKEGDKKVSGLSHDQIEHLRRKCKTNLYFLSKGVLGYNLLSPNLHMEVAKWMLENTLEQYKEILLPRSHFKSTLCTISDSVQIALPDDCKDQPYPRNLGPEVRVNITHEAQAEAEKFLFHITHHFTGNPVLMGLFPECVPNAKVQRINKQQLELPRQSPWGEPTFDTMGVGAKSQGRHYNYIKADDLYGKDARDSKAERESTISWVNNIQSLLITPKTDHIDFVGTRWAHDDVYAHIEKVYGDKLKKLIKSIYYTDKDGNKQLIFPEQFTWESIEILRKDPKVWNAQYINNPFEGGSQFDPSWLRFYNLGPNGQIVTFSLDQSRSVNIKDLDIIILIDPAMTGNAGFIVTGVDKWFNIYILEATKKVWNPPELVEYIFKSVMKYKPRIVAIEEVLFSGLFQHWLKTEMSKRCTSFRVVPVKTRQKAKEARILGLSNYFSGGQIYFHQSQKDLVEEYYEFGASDNIHLLDALAYGPELWRIGANENRIQSYREAEKALLAGRDKLTGYGAYK